MYRTYCTISYHALLAKNARGHRQGRIFAAGGEGVSALNCYQVVMSFYLVSFLVIVLINQPAPSPPTKIFSSRPRRMHLKLIPYVEPPKFLSSRHRGAPALPAPPATLMPVGDHFDKCYTNRLERITSQILSLSFSKFSHVYFRAATDYKKIN